MNKYIKVFLGIVIVAGAALAIANGRNQPQGSQDTGPLKIGYFGPLTGTLWVNTGETVYDALRLAHHEHGEVNGRPVEVIYEDDACDPQKAVSAATKLITQDHVKILLSLCSGSTIAVAPIAERYGVVLVSAVATTPKLTKAGDYIFRVSGSAEVTAASVAPEISRLGYKKVAIIYENSEYSVSWKDSFAKKFLDSPDKSIVEQAFGSKDTDVRTQLLKLSESKPDLILASTLSPVSSNVILKQYRELGLTMPLLGNENFSLSSVLKGPYAEGVMVSEYDYDLNSSQLKHVEEAHKQFLGKPATELVYAALTYDAYNLVWEAMKKCNGDDPNCVKQELYKVKGYPGASGTITIDSNGDTDRRFVLRRVENGKLVEVK